MPLLLSSVTPDALIQFGGRLHPLLLHMPIGLFAAVALVEIAAIVRRKPLDQSVRMTLVWMTALSAAMAMTSGLLLSREDSYGSDALQTHKLLGIGVAVGSMLMAICASKTSLRWAYGLLLIATGAALFPAGHIGGTITHGDDFLTEPFADKPAALRPAADAASAVTDAGGTQSAFAANIAPIIHEKCLGCHSASRHKGGLSLETPDSILAGAEAGPVIVAGDASASELAIRLRLPLEDKYHMPPESKPQLSEAEIAAIEQWINAGAETSPSDALSFPDAVSPAPETEDLSPAPTPSEDALAALRAAQAHVEFVDPANGLLWIDFAAAPTTDDAQALALLTPVKDFIADLSLAGTRSGDGVLALAATMPRLHALNMSRTACNAAGLRSLSGHATLAELRLTQTRLDDAAVDSLIALPALTRIYLWNAGISPEAAERLHAGNAELIVDVGVPTSAQPLETEAAIALSGEASPPGNAGANPAPVQTSLLPANAVCPVSGKPVNPKFAIVHDGKVIGFCCQDCAAQFWSDPEKYPLPK